MRKYNFLLLVLMAGVLAACAGSGKGGVSASGLTSENWKNQASLVRGGRLYDKWYAVAERPTPTTPHPAYPVTAKYAKKAKSNWRCKECHGWDYMGKEGAYSSGKHYTGIKGIRSMSGADTSAVLAILKNNTHSLAGKMSDQDFQDLAIFVSQGQVDMDGYIDRSTGKVIGGDVGKGEAFFHAACANCHGREGRSMKGMPALGKISNGNPWETLHKILNGQPDEGMPSMRALGREIPSMRAMNFQAPTDILAFIQTLPQEK
jgi:cytochrome c553